MVRTEEQKREYAKIYRENNKQKLADKNKIYRENNKQKLEDKKKKYYQNNKQKIADKDKIYYEKNRQKITEKHKIYQQTPNGKKRQKISSWKGLGIITNDYDYWYELYIEQNHCWHCENEFIDSTDRNLDHNHNINDKENIRGILCRICNIKDIYK